MTGTQTQRPQILERMAMGYEPIGDFEVMFKPEKSRTQNYELRHKTQIKMK